MDRRGVSTTVALPGSVEVKEKPAPSRRRTRRKRRCRPIIPGCRPPTCRTFPSSFIPSDVAKEWNDLPKFSPGTTFPIARRRRGEPFTWDCPLLPAAAALADGRPHGGCEAQSPTRLARSHAAPAAGQHAQLREMAVGAKNLLRSAAGGSFCAIRLRLLPRARAWVRQRSILECHGEAQHPQLAQRRV